MWDWSGNKTTPPPVRDNTNAAAAQSGGVTPFQMNRPVPMAPQPVGQNPNAPQFTQRPIPQPNAPIYRAPQQNGFAQQPFNPQQPFMGNGGYQQPFAPQQPFGNGYAPQPYAPQPQMYPGQPQNFQQPYGYPPQQAPNFNQYQNQYAFGQNTFGYQSQPNYGQSSAYQPQQNAPFNPQAMAMGQDSRENWEWQFTQMDLPNMELIEATYVMLDPAWLAELQKAFKRTRRDFLKYVGYHHTNELIAAGLDEEGIRCVKKGRAPENFNIHVRIPFDYGGSNDFSNLCLIQTHPYHTEIHKFLDLQTLSAPNMKPMKLYIPAPKGKVYFPGEIEISSGGTSRHDRSVYAGFLESTFEYIEQRSAMDR